MKNDLFDEIFGSGDEDSEGGDGGGEEENYFDSKSIVIPQDQEGDASSQFHTRPHPTEYASKRSLDPSLSEGRYKGVAVSRDDVLGSSSSKSKHKKKKKKKELIVPQSELMNIQRILDLETVGDEEIEEDEVLNQERDKIQQQIFTEFFPPPPPPSSTTDFESSNLSKRKQKRKRKKKSREEKEEHIEIMKHISTQRKKKLRTAKSTFNQKLLFDIFMKYWICYIQQSVHLSNSIDPQQLQKNEENEEVSQVIKSTILEYSKLQQQLLEQEKVNIVPPPPQKEENLMLDEDSEISDLWNQMNQQYLSFKPELLKSLNLWDSKTNVHQQTQNFRTIQMSVDKRIQNDLDQNLDEYVSKSTNNNDNHLVPPPPPPPPPQNTSQKEQEPLQFNDSDFFQVQVKEFLEDIGGVEKNMMEKMTSIDETIEKGILEAAKKTSSRNSKKGKRRGRFLGGQEGGKGLGRAGRGQKVVEEIFEVVPELVGFMPARPFEYPKSTDILFNNLFGGSRRRKK